MIVGTIEGKSMDKGTNWAWKTVILIVLSVIAWLIGANLGWLLYALKG